VACAGDLAGNPYGRYLDHGNWTEIGLGASICSALPAAGWALPAALYIGGWMLMTAAMMLPTTLPLLDRFRRLVAARPERGRLIALLITGYLLAWIAFGLAAHLLDTGLHLAAQRADWLVTHGWLVGALVLATAGLFQFSRLKYRCLDKCRTPFGFLAQHWHGSAPCAAARSAPRPVLRRLLPGDHAADVRRRHRQCRLDCSDWAH
jgi:predicted metal-binding membrane protein